MKRTIRVTAFAIGLFGVPSVLLQFVHAWPPDQRGLIVLGCEGRGPYFCSSVSD